MRFCFIIRRKELLKEKLLYMDYFLNDDNLDDDLGEEGCFSLFSYHSINEATYYATKSDFSTP